MSLLLLVLALVIGAGVGALVMRTLGASRGAADDAGRATELAELRAQAASAGSERAHAQAEAATARGELGRLRAEAQSAITEARAEVAEARAQVAEARVDAETARADQAAVSARLAAAQAERDAAAKRADELAADRESLVNQFKALSAETLAEQSRQADATAEQRLVATRELMGPVTESLLQLNQRINDVEKQRSEMTASLGEQVRTVVATSENLRRETHALSTALRKPQVRGAWGEMQLKRVVEIAGMLEHCDFYQQATDQTTADTRIRPDMKVMMGDQKFIYVDAKVPLSAYLDAMESASEPEREARLKQFSENVKTHIDALSAKEYWKSATGSPEFVVLFIPAEALAAEALAQRPDLHEYAAGKRIVVASPTTLIAMLRTIAYSWKQAALADSAAEVFGLARELHDRLSTLGGNFAKLGRSLTAAVSAYNSTLGSLENRVFVSARRLRDLKVTDKQLELLGGVEETPRPLAAPELLANAAQAELEMIAPREPLIAELVDEQQPALRPATMRELG